MPLDSTMSVMPSVVCLLCIEVGSDGSCRRRMRDSDSGSMALRLARIEQHPRTAFVLAGGASLEALQAGMLRALYERGITPDFLVGTSAGALNAAYVASRPQTMPVREPLAA
jgi:hypothetical protein